MSGIIPCGVHCGIIDGKREHCIKCHEEHYGIKILKEESDGTTKTWNQSTHGPRPLFYEEPRK